MSETPHKDYWDAMQIDPDVLDLDQKVQQLAASIIERGRALTIAGARLPQGSEEQLELVMHATQRMTSMVAAVDREQLEALVHTMASRAVLLELTLEACDPALMQQLRATGL